MIRRKTETRGRYDVGVYEVDIDVDMRRDALQFAKQLCSEQLISQPLTVLLTEYITSLNTKNAVKL